MKNILHFIHNFSPPLFIRFGFRVLPFAPCYWPLLRFFSFPFNILRFTLCLLPFYSSAQTLQVITKTIEKTFEVPQYAKVQVWGERSDVEIMTWNKNEIKATIL